MTREEIYRRRMKLLQWLDRGIGETDDMDTALGFAMEIRGLLLDLEDEVGRAERRAKRSNKSPA